MGASMDGCIGGWVGGCMSSGIHDPLPFEDQESNSIISVVRTSIINIIY